jgi:hypothetical protein
VAEGDRRDLRLLVVLVIALAIFAGLLVIGISFLGEFGSAFSDGIGLRTAVLWGFGVTVGLMVLLALASGDSLIGEIQFMLAAFFTFFAVITLLIAWVF